MPELPISALSERQQKQVTNARAAMDRGNFEYTVEICIPILDEEPSCLEVRQLLRAAQQHVFAQASGGLGGLFVKLASLGISYSGYSFVKRKPAKAMSIGEHSLSMDPYNAKGLSLIAHGAGELGLYETEAFCLETICERYPDKSDKLERLCKAWIKIGKTDKALTIAERLARLKPSNTHVQELVKSASVAHSINRGKWENKDEDFRGKLKDRRSSETLEKSNRIEDARSDDFEMARSYIEEVHQDPQNLDTYKRLVRALISGEEFAEAISWLDRAFELPQAGADPLLRQLRSDLKLRSAEKELYDLKIAVEGRLDRKKLERIDYLEKELSVLRMDEAREMVQQFPNDFGQRFNYGEMLLANGYVDDAIQQFQVAQRSPSLKYKSQVFLGRCFMKKNLFDLALEQLRVVNQSSSTMDAFKKEVLYLTATCFESIGDKEQAIVHYKTIYSSDIGYRDVAEKIDTFYRRG